MKCPEAESKMPRCKNCNAIMEADVENQRYICECGYEILWIGALKRLELENAYE